MRWRNDVRDLPRLRRSRSARPRPAPVGRRKGDARIHRQRAQLSKAYLTGQTGVDDLWLRPAEFYAKQQIDLIYGDAVAFLDGPERRLRLTSGLAVSWDYLVLATGARCRPLPVPGAELDG